MVRDFICYIYTLRMIPLLAGLGFYKCILNGLCCSHYLPIYKAREVYNDLLDLTLVPQYRVIIRSSDETAPARFRIQEQRRFSRQDPSCINLFSSHRHHLESQGQSHEDNEDLS